jgi:nitric oxide reductase activation protein
MSPEGPRQATDRARIADTCDRAQLLVADQVDRLVRELEDLLLPRRRLGMRPGYPSGRRLDLRRAMAFESDARLYDRLWSRPTIPRRRDSAFLLLVDLSGSMRGEKTEAALAGTWLMAATLSRLEVPFAVIGFQDVLIPFCPFGVITEDQIRGALTGLPEEVSGTRLAGNNCPEFNDDAPCLLEAAEELLGQPVRQRVLIVVSDGLPEGRRSTRDELHTAVGELSGIRGLRLVGIGLGPSTEHVRDYYPESVANVKPGRLAEEIGGVLRKALWRSAV